MYAAVGRMFQSFANFPSDKQSDILSPEKHGRGVPVDDFPI